VKPTESPSVLSLVRHTPFVLYFMAQALSSFARQISAVTIGWQMYEVTKSPFMLGLVGLVQFLPTALLVFYAGDAADRYDRRRVVQACRLLQGAVAICLAFGTYEGVLTSHWLLAAAAVFGVATAFEFPSTAAILPAVVPQGMLQQATAMSTATLQLATITGPALGGFAYAAAPALPYSIMAACWLFAFASYLFLVIEFDFGKAPARSFAVLFAGFRFVRSDPALIGTISLDLVAVLLGGATALMPIYAQDILHTGPWGLGILRAAPAVGALITGFYLTRFPIRAKVGVRLFQSVMVFGFASVGFALSKWMGLSLVALTVMGGSDMVSVVIRTSLVQLRTPDDMRGRVGAVNYLFIHASNQVGEFESGMMAALLGAVGSAVFGGIGCIAVALLWMKLFPTLRDIERLE
jgi:MFS family permease